MPSTTTIIDNRFTLDEHIGSGAMGSVYRGVDKTTGDPVAVKALKPEIVQLSPDAVARFQREGEALRRLNHPNIVAMLTAVSENDTHYLVMEYISGGDLRQLLQKEGQLPIEQALTIALDLADALTRAHRLKIIHRDIKPANVLLSENNTPRLTDFGVARIGLDSELTQDGAMVGTFAYLSPEAFLGQPLDERSDIWSFGVMLYQMLAGKRPFGQSNSGTALNDILNVPLPDIRALRPEIPESLSALFYRMLTKNRTDRVPSIRLVGAELEAILKQKEWLETTSDSHAFSIRREFSLKPDEQSSQFTPLFTPTPTPKRPHNLPATTAPFIGRHQELKKLLKLASDTQTRLITILGPGGMGKTRLSLEVGSNLLEESYSSNTYQPLFHDGIYFVPLAPLANASQIPLAIAETIGFQLQSDEDEQTQLINYLRPKSLFIILDNIEHLSDGAQLVHTLLQSAPNLNLLVTSRHKLNLSGESVFPIGGMDFPATAKAKDILHYESVELFIQSAKRVQLDFTLTDDDVTHIARISQLTQGSPLAIVLAASWVDMLPLADIASEMGQDVDFLETELADLPERQRSARAVFTYSWRLLSDKEQGAFAKMSQFRGSFSRQAAQKVAGVSLAMLTRLANKSLVQRNVETGRFSIHELLRQFGFEKLTAQNEVDAIRAAHSHHYLSFLRWLQPALQGENQMEAIRELNEDFDNVRHAWQWAIEHNEVAALETAVIPLFLFCEYSSKGSAATEILTNALTLCSPSQQPLLWLRLRYALSRWQPLTFAERQEHLELVRQHGEPDDVANWLLDHWMTIDYTSLFMAGQLDPVAWATEALTLYQQSGNRFGEANALFTFGYMHTYLAQPDTIVTYLEQCLALNEEIGNIYGQATTNGQLALTHIGFTGEYTHVIAYSSQAMALSQQLGSAGMTAYYQSLLGWSLCYVGQIDEAKQNAYESLAAAKANALGMAIGQSMALNGYLLCLDGEYEAALEMVADFERYDSNQMRMIFYCMRVRGTAYTGLKQTAVGWQFLKPVIGASLMGQIFIQMGLYLPVLAMLLAQAGEEETAVSLLALTYTHPWSRPAGLSHWQDLNQLHQNLKAKFAPDQYQALWQQGQEADFVATITQTMALLDKKLAQPEV